MQGDEAANHIVMATGDTGALVIDGRAIDGSPTMINGQPGPFVVDDFNNSIQIRMRAGNDLVEISQGDFAEHVFVGMGRGADRIVLGGGAAGSSDGLKLPATERNADNPEEAPGDNLTSLGQAIA